MFKGPVSIMLYVTDLGRSVGFYEGVLGFGFKGYWDAEHSRSVRDYAEAGTPGHAELTVGETSLGLHIAAEGQPTGGGAEHHVMLTDLTAYHREVVSRGAPAPEPKLMPWGATMFSVADPDGHVWNFVAGQDTGAAD